jgi:hypothetical protein
MYALFKKTAGLGGFFIDRISGLSGGVSRNPNPIVTILPAFRIILSQLKTAISA